MLLVGWQEGHPACKKTEWWGAGVIICLCKVQIFIWPSWCHCHSLSLASVKSRLVPVPAHLSNPRQSLEDRKMDVCVSVLERCHVMQWVIVCLFCICQKPNVHCLNFTNFLYALMADMVWSSSDDNALYSHIIGHTTQGTINRNVGTMLQQAVVNFTVFTRVPHWLIFSHTTVPNCAPGVKYVTCHYGLESILLRMTTKIVVILRVAFTVINIY